MIRALAQELAADGITVNGISPGPFGTEMNIPVMQNPETNAQFMASIPLGRWGRVEEVGALAAISVPMMQASSPAWTLSSTGAGVRNDGMRRIFFGREDSLAWN